jgi:1-acyl-sn-glycerol-3-phosphate acyltransferase
MIEAEAYSAEVALATKAGSASPLLRCRNAGAGRHNRLLTKSPGTEEPGKMPADCLTTQSTYQTPMQAGSRIAAGFPTLVFYTKILGIVRRAARLAAKGLYDNRRWVESSIATIRALESVGGRFEFKGLDVIARLQSPCVFVGNHMSILETFVLPCLVVPHREVTFVVKESLIKYPLFGHVMRSRHPVVVGRESPREDLGVVMEDGQKRLEANISIILFPQTTRSVQFDAKKFNTLGVKLARRCSVPVVPFALKTDAWGLGRRLKDFGRICPEKTVHIHFGETMNVQGGGKEEHNLVVEFIEKNLAAWK